MKKAGPWWGFVTRNLPGMTIDPKIEGNQAGGIIGIEGIDCENR